jgi:hypothetical protein
MQTGPAAGLTGALLVETSYIYLPLPSGKAEALLGRADPQEHFFPDIDLSQHGGELGGVSRKHARLLAEGDQVFLEDLHSTNATFLNQKKLQPGRRYPLKDGDEIRLGRVILTYHARWSG